jgi:hypothetical protein
MAKKIKPIELTPAPKMTKKAIAKEKPLKLNMSFEQAIKKMVTTPVKKTKK